ncbi:protein translocase subunit SecD [Demetria terragena]|uniref:protein translocase subunit SecD n=1 Tax=Demetria terragena TaxID=63959 RepID=UPI001FE02ED6|nr:protein translocase subunit SecD [Demetria terragena]
MSPSSKPGRKKARPKTTIVALLLIVGVLFGGIALTTMQSPAGQWTPKLGLDLEGGRQIVLEPQVGEDQEINSQQVEQAVSIIRRRVDGSGVAEAEVTTLGASNIVVAIPGEPSEDMLDSLSASSQLTFRPVIVEQQNQPVEITLPQPPEPPKASAKPSSSGSKATAKPSATAKSSATSSGARGTYPEAYPAAESPSPKPTKSSSSKAPAKSTTKPAADKPANPSDEKWAQEPVESLWVKAGVVEKGATYQELVGAYNCADTEHQQLSAAASPKAPTVMCDQQAQAKYIVGPVEVNGSMVEDASSGPETNQQGQQTGGTQINLEFDDQGKKAFGDMTTRLSKFPETQPQNKSAIIIDGQVLSALGTNDAITNGKAQITGSFTPKSGKVLAEQLKFGALPFSFEEQTNDQISPQLGQDQLRMGLIAGVIGLVLVIIYSLFQYRALGLVTVASLGIAGLLTYGTVTILGHLANFRLTMAGVTGLIVAIGVTADSFIVYFERVRDEVRSGRALRAAVETGWGRARRTIIISDVVNFIAAAVLYLLSESNVKAFAFTLGLSTLIDILVVMLFTHPALTLLARTKFFGGGHPWSGLDPERLGAKTATYAGRGRVTIADRQAAAAQEGTA